MFAISKDETLTGGELHSPSPASYPEPLQAAPSAVVSCPKHSSAKQPNAAGLERERGKSEFQVLLSYALQSLARREYATVELRRKLSVKASAQAAAKTEEHIGQVIDALLLDGSLSDERFTAEFVRSRIRKGYGPLRIRMDLIERGVPDRLAEEQLTRPAEFWQQQAADICLRKFGDPSEPAASPVTLFESEEFADEIAHKTGQNAASGGKKVSQQRWNRCARFLSQRGFPADLIYRTLDGRLLD